MVYCENFCLKFSQYCGTESTQVVTKQTLLNFPWPHNNEKEISELTPRYNKKSLTMVGFEPLTSGPDNLCSNQLIYQAKLGGAAHFLKVLIAFWAR